MFKALFKLIMNLAGTIVQLVLLPINLIFTNALPEVSEQISQVNNGIAEVFRGTAWGLDIIPRPVIIALLFIITCEIAKVTIYIGAHSLVRVWHVLQKVKFW